MDVREPQDRGADEISVNETCIDASAGGVDDTGFDLDIEDNSSTGDADRGSPGSSPGVARDLVRGQLLGRYVVLEMLGRGSMGVVYAAYDPELDRRIALKLLQYRASGGRAARERLVREAKNMARLSHPNVIAVHDVGSVDGRVFIAMEFVDGDTLESDVQGDWRRTLALFVSAGRGLAAAHAVGLVHRDFKPENVLVGRDGSVRVLDFGIARQATEGEELLGAAVAADVDGDLKERARELQILQSEPSTLTRTGALLGTPAYMSPEQHLGRRADAASDQFSFCVSLWEALYGQRPFAGDTHATLALQVCEGRVRDPPTNAGPDRIREHLERGLSRLPQDRFASMDALLEALERPPRRLSRRWILAAAVVVLALVFGGVYLRATWISPSAALLPCQEGARIQLAETWNPERRRELASAFESTGKGYAGQAWLSAAARLDVWGEEWVVGRTDACEATRVREIQSESLMDLRMLCFDRHRVELEALLELLEGADVDPNANVVEHAVELAHRLDGVDDCVDVRGLMARSEVRDIPPLDLETSQSELARASVLGQARAFDEAVEVARSMVARGREAGYRPFLAEALYLLGRYQARTGETAGGIRSLLEAIPLADAIGADTLRARAWIELAHVYGIELGELGPAMERGEVARAVLRREGGDDELRGRLSRYLGVTQMRAGNFEEARALHQEALALRRRELGDTHPDVATSLSDLGTVERELEEFGAARRHQEEAWTLRRQVLGDQHPDVGRSLTNLGNLSQVEGDYLGALKFHQDALRVFEASLGPDHIYVGKVETNRANALLELGRYEEAVAAYRRSLNIIEAIVGEHSPTLAISLDDLSVALGRLKRYDEAILAGRRALAIRELAFGLDDIRVAPNLDNLGNLLSKRGLSGSGEAAAYHRRAISILELKLGFEDVRLAMPLANLALDEIARGRLRVANDLLERAIAIAEANPVRDLEAVIVGFAQAQLLWARGDREAAVQLAREVLTLGVAEGGEEHGLRADVRAWISAHEGAR